MSTITRPAKAGGETDFLLEVTLHNNIHIKAAEVDADFNEIYTDYNGNVDNTNIAPLANIATSKIAQDAGLQTGHYADNSITSAKILDGTIIAADLAPDSVTTTKILDGAVTLAKLAAGSAIRHGEQVDDTAVVVTTTETTILTHASFTPEGPTSIITNTVTVNGFASFSVADMLLQITIRLKRNAITIETASARMFVPAGSVAATELPFCITFTSLQAFSAGAEVFTVTAEKVEAGAGADIVTISSIRSLVVEHA